MNHLGVEIDPSIRILFEANILFWVLFLIIKVVDIVTERDQLIVFARWYYSTKLAQFSFGSLITPSHQWPFFKARPKLTAYLFAAALEIDIMALILLTAFLRTPDRLPFTIQAAGAFSSWACRPIALVAFLVNVALLIFARYVESRVLPMDFPAPVKS